MLKKLFRILKRLFYLSNLFVAYFAYAGVISWLWLVACFVASLFFRYLAKPARYQPPAIQVETDGAPKVDLEAASEIVMEFGKVMLRTNYKEKFYDENELPLTKEYILEALLNLYRAASNDEEKKPIQAWNDGLVPLPGRRW